MCTVSKDIYIYIYGMCIIGKLVYTSVDIICLKNIRLCYKSQNIYNKKIMHTWSIAHGIRHGISTMPFKTTGKQAEKAGDA